VKDASKSPVCCLEEKLPRHRASLAGQKHNKAKGIVKNTRSVLTGHGFVDVLTCK